MIVLLPKAEPGKSQASLGLIGFQFVEICIKRDPRHIVAWLRNNNSL